MNIEFFYKGGRGIYCQETDTATFPNGESVRLVHACAGLRKDVYSARIRQYVRRKKLPSKNVFYSENGKYLFVERPDESMFSIIQAVKLVGLDHTGWYCDDFQEDTYEPVVAKIHTSRGLLTIPGYIPSYGGECVLDWSSRVLTPKSQDEYEDALRQAAYAADSFAEKEAEKVRNYQETEELKREISELFSGEIHELHHEVTGIIQQIRNIRDDMFFDYQLQEFPLRQKLAELQTKRAELLNKVAEIRKEIRWLS